METTTPDKCMKCRWYCVKDGVLGAKVDYCELFQGGVHRKCDPKVVNNPPDGQVMYSEEITNREGNLIFYHIYPHSRIVSMCGVDDAKIVQIKVRMNLNVDKPSPYWGWWDFEDNTYSMIWPSKVQSEVCFTYGHKASEDAGRGKQVNLIIEKVKD